MNWNIIALLSTIGLCMGILSALGLTKKKEPFLWLGFSIISSFILANKIEEKLFIHGFTIGVAWGMLNAIITSLLFTTYLKNNPQLREQLGKVTFMNPRYFGLLTGPVIGALTGSVLGGLCLLAEYVL